jgi:dolichol kinase
MELFPFKFGKSVVNDNLTVPVLTGVLVLFAYPIFA